MTNRRSFFKSLLGLFIAPSVAKVLPIPHPVGLGYKGCEFYDTGIIYAPYIPLLVMKTYDTNNIPSTINKDLYHKGTIQFYGDALVQG